MFIEISLLTWINMANTHLGFLIAKNPQFLITHMPHNDVFYKWTQLTFPPAYHHFSTLQVTGNATLIFQKMHLFLFLSRYLFSNYVR